MKFSISFCFLLLTWAVSCMAMTSTSVHDLSTDTLLSIFKTGDWREKCTAVVTNLQLCRLLRDILDPQMYAVCSVLGRYEGDVGRAVRGLAGFQPVPGTNIEEQQQKARDVMEDLLVNYPDLDLNDINQAVQRAASANQVAMLRLLFQYHLDRVDITSALTTAFQFPSPDAFRYILKKMPKDFPDRQSVLDNLLKDALMLSWSERRPFVHALRKYDAKVTKETLQIAIRETRLHADRIDGVRRLWRLFKLQNPHQLTPDEMIAYRRNRLSNPTFLHFDRTRNSAFLSALLNDQVSLVSYFLKEGADIHMNTDQPIALAVSMNRREIAQFLVKQGLSLNNHDFYLLRMAILNNGPPALRLLRSLHEQSGQPFPQQKALEILAEQTEMAEEQRNTLYSIIMMS